MSAKELGQIHTVTRELPFITGVSPPYTVGEIDVPGDLTNQLQRMVRAGNFFKTVGIDMSLTFNGDNNESAVVSGYIRYYAPTRGRCEAFRGAFKAMAEQMSMQGISMRDNALYDFKVPLNNDLFGGTFAFRNQATLDGVNGLALHNASNPGAGIFEVHNASVRPVYEGTNVFDEGFDTLLAAGGAKTDFVINDQAPFIGNEHVASLEYENIPFQLTLSTTADENATATFQWRPDPALYLAVLCGQFQIVFTDVTTASGLLPPNILGVNVAIMVSGWKSIMGNPDKKKKSSRKRSRK